MRLMLAVLVVFAMVAAFTASILASAAPNMISSLFAAIGY